MNRLNRRTKIAALVAAVLATLFVAGCGRSSRGHGEYDPARVEEHVKKHVDRMLSKLDATDEQRQKAYALRDRLMPDIQALMKERGADRALFGELWNQPTFDGAKLNALVDQRSDELRALGHKLADATAEFHALLTPEQREKLRKTCEGRWGHHW